MPLLQPARRLLLGSWTVRWVMDRMKWEVGVSSLGRALLHTALAAALLCGCTGVAYVPARDSDSDEPPGPISYRDELRTQCAKGRSGDSCWDLALYTSTQGDHGRALTYAKKACLLGVGAACHEVTVRTGKDYETMVAEQMAQNVPEGLSEPERCRHWQRTARHVSSSLTGLYNWVAYKQERACASIERAELEAQEAEYAEQERRAQQEAAREEDLHERRKPCLLRCIAGRASHKRFCRAMGQPTSGPCHDRSAAQTHRCLAVCEAIQ
jgi:hypothetical protein